MGARKVERDTRGKTMAIYLSDNDVKTVIQMPDIFNVVEQAFKDHGLGLASNLHRQRARVPKGVYRVMSGAMPGIGAMGSKVGLHGFEVPAGVERAHDMTVLSPTAPSSPPPPP